ncbi:hypothetical protein [Yimella sp. NH-Cas1]|uniref:AbiTii domain-containing protein n=1 Tax=Yimella sp. NH-Cas1 TaxID=2917726 RepID=UPI001EFB2340|nr:hypothetical protein [Yimella sp. NH-Cas1]MCG8653994.1 hypothetical protein [Yimella sp. NH-Cas1]
MSTVLAQAVEELSGSTTELPSALRRLLVIASRIKAPHLAEWVRNELNGYFGETPVPEYRQGPVVVSLRYLGSYGSERTLRQGTWDLPEKLRLGDDWGWLRQSVAALAELSKGESDPGVSLPGWWIATARDLIDKGEMSTVAMMVLDSARIVFPRTQISGVLDRIQTEALSLVLALESVSPEIGNVGGPTVEEPAVADVLRGLTINTGDGSSIVFGSGNAVATGAGAEARVAPGDVEALLREVKSALDDEAATALRDAIASDDGRAGSAVQSWLQRVRAGAFSIAGGMTSNGAYDLAVMLVDQTFPGWGG